MSVVKKLLVGLVTLLLLATIVTWFVTSPMVIHYDSGEVETRSVYYTGLDGNGHLLDANASFARIDEQTNRLHICLEAGLRENCQSYAIIRTEGILGVIALLLK